jgi:hypothetical protein
MKTTLIVIDLVLTAIGFYVMWNIGYNKGIKDGRQEKLDELEEFHDDSNR